VYVEKLDVPMSSGSKNTPSISASAYDKVICGRTLKKLAHIIQYPGMKVRNHGPGHIGAIKIESISTTWKHVFCLSTSRRLFIHKIYE
jgi:hypothetical protein